MNRRNRMDKFDLDEVSFVTRPAQQLALANIAKADDVQKVDLVDFVTGEAEGHQHSISVYRDCDGKVGLIVGFAQAPGQDYSHDHQVYLGDDGSPTMTFNNGHTHELDGDALRSRMTEALFKAGVEVPGEVSLADLLTKGIEQGGDNGNHVAEESSSMTDETKKAADAAALQKKLDDTAAKLEKAEAVNALSADERAHYETLDQAGRDAFVGKSADERKADISKAQDADPVIYKAADGTEFRKSDDPRLVSMAKGLDDERKVAKAAQDRLEKADLEKRASEDLAHMAGTVEVRAAILKAVDGIEDQATREAAHQALKANDAGVSGATTELGTADAGKGVAKAADLSKADAEAEMDRLAKELASKDSINYHVAYGKVADANADLYAKAMGH